MDSRFRLYSAYQGNNVGSSAEDCSAWCLQNPDNLLGFSYSSNGFGDCYCELHGELPNPLPTYTNPSSTAAIGPGSGSIQGTSPFDGGEDFECYVYPDFAPPEPFIRVGNGECIDSEGNQFSYFGRLNNFDETIEWQCEDYCSQNLGTTFVGFETHVFFEPEAIEPNTECRCLFSGGQLPSFTITNYTEGGLPDANMTRSGDGMITNSTYDDLSFFDGDVTCYRYNVSGHIIYV